MSRTDEILTPEEVQEIRDSVRLEAKEVIERLSMIEATRELLARSLRATARVAELGSQAMKALVDDFPDAYARSREITRLRADLERWKLRSLLLSEASQRYSQSVLAACRLTDEISEGL